MRYKLKNENVNREDILELICENRGVDYNKLDVFLNPDERVIISSEYYDNMQKACEVILEAVKQQKVIGILIDSDADGYLSASMVVNYLWHTFGFCKFVFLMHEEKKHGLTPQIMKQIEANNIDLMIIPDASSSDLKQHKELKEKDIEVVVIDHHEADKIPTDAIVVNNQLSSKGNKTLSGGGMVLKVLEHLDKLTGNNNAHNYLDLASVAMVADSMMMNHAETRYYVLKGLRNINNPLLMELYRPDASRNFEMISFDIAPTINAFIRVGTMQEKRDLFSALIGVEDKREIEVRGQGKFELPLPEYISKIASRIKRRQTTMVKSALEHENTEIFTENLPITICILDSSALKDLTGLIGNKLVELYNKPAIVLKETKNDYLSGSGRSTDTFEDFRQYIKNTGDFDFAEGHAGAFGCRVKREKLFGYMSRNTGKSLGEEADVFLVDKAYYNMVSALEILTVGELEDEWAKGFEKPKFYIKLDNLKGNEVDIIGQNRNTIRIKHNNITYVKFKCTPEEIAEIEDKKIKEVEIIGSFAQNEYMDRIYPQVIIDKLEVKAEEVPKIQIPPDFRFGFQAFTW